MLSLISPVGIQGNNHTIDTKKNQVIRQYIACVMALLGTKKGEIGFSSLIHHPRPYFLVDRLQRGGTIYVSRIEADCFLPSWQAIARHSPKIQFSQVKSKRWYLNVTVVDNKDWSSRPA